MDFQKQRRIKLSGLRTFIVHDMGEFCSIRLKLAVSLGETNNLPDRNYNTEINSYLCCHITAAGYKYPGLTGFDSGQKW